MKLHYILAAVLATSLLVEKISADGENANRNRSNRVVRQTNADQMVQNILKWLQGVYTQQSRRIRQGTLREYLPPTNTQKPRPFKTARPPGIDDSAQYIGYPPAGSITPQPPFTIYSNPPAGETYPTIGYPQPTYPDQSTPPRPSGYPTGPTGTTIPGGYPTPTFSTQGSESSTPGFTGYPRDQPTPGVTTEFPTFPPVTITAPPERPGFPTQPPSEISTGYPERPSFPTQPPAELTSTQPAPTQPPPAISTGYPTEAPEITEEPVTTARPIVTVPSETETESATGELSTSPPQVITTSSTAAPEEPAPTTQSPEANTIPTDGPEKPGTEATVVEDDSAHPPHIHALDVECAKDMMTINMEFNREFNGIIYSKGYYNMPECRYVKENSGQTKYTFTVNLNMCGTEFINAFDTQGQSYLENVLVLQNELGIQEIWDTVRAVRCLWEGNLKESLSVALSVGMLSQELVTFSGDTAVAKLDILLGRGPLGQAANGLVKIGEPMTLVVSVSGDPGFDIQVKDCRATDSTGDNTIPLTDDDGCVLKPKLFGAFQKTRNTGDTGASIIAYAYFNAFKFPDVMDLMIECNIELCKTDCEMCTDPNQKLEPGRRRKRDLYSYNQTLHDGVTMGKHLRIILPEDLIETPVIDLSKNNGVCMSTQSFVFSTALLISLLTASCLFSAYMWLKTQQFKSMKM